MNCVPQIVSSILRKEKEHRRVFAVTSASPLERPKSPLLGRRGLYRHSPTATQTARPLHVRCGWSAPSQMRDGIERPSRQQCVGSQHARRVRGREGGRRASFIYSANTEHVSEKMHKEPLPQPPLEKARRPGDWDFWGWGGTALPLYTPRCGPSCPLTEPTQTSNINGRIAFSLIKYQYMF